MNNRSHKSISQLYVRLFGIYRTQPYQQEKRIILTEMLALFLTMNILQVPSRQYSCHATVLEHGMNLDSPFKQAEGNASFIHRHLR